VLSHLHRCARGVLWLGRLPFRGRPLLRRPLFLIAMDSAFRPAAVRPPFLTGAGAFVATTLGAVAPGAGARAAAFAALIAAQRFFVPAMIARLPAALSFRFAGGVGPTLVGGFEPGSTDRSAAFRPGPGNRSVVVGP
jgi:hypothetical protein